MNTSRTTATATAATAAPTFDTNEMRVVHRGVRRESRLLAELIAAVEPGDTARAGVLAAHFDLYLTGLESHHHGEDERLWPLLLGRVDLEADIVLRMEAQHERVAATLAAAGRHVKAWATTAGADERDAAVAALVEHRAALVEHLDDEEANLLPLAQRLLTAAEWQAYGDHFAESVTDKPTLLMLFGIVMEDADPAERAALVGGLPLVGRIAWRLVGRPMYARMVRRVRG